MTLARAVLGRRLLFRLYLYELIIFGALVLAGFVVGKYVFEPRARANEREGVVWAAESALTMRNDRVLFEKQLVALDHVRIAITIFDESGRAIGHSGEKTAGALEANDLARIRQGEVVNLPGHSFAVGSFEDGHLAAYAIVSWTGRQSPFRFAAFTMLVVVLIIGIASIPFARSIARPLERLSKTAHEFGLGDLTARARIDRNDEIGDVSQAFDQMADRIESLRRAEKELLANISHELRTPLSRIRVVVELGAEEDPEAAKRYMTDIAEDLTEVEQILGDIIATARLDLANDRSKDPYPPLRLTTLPVRTLLDSLVNKFREQYPKRRLDCAFGETDGVLACDRVMLKHAIGNLLDNAQKYSPAHEPIVLRVDKEGEDIRISVSDRGAGIDPADAPHVFTPFFRAERSRSRETGGVGLGLTLAKRIVEAHGGTIEVVSDGGSGTMVSVVLGDVTATAR